MSLYHYQPFKALYILIHLVVIIPTQVPKWLSYAGPNRRGSWNIGRHLAISALRHIIQVVHNIGIVSGANHDHREIAGPDGTWIPAVPDDLILGAIKTRAEAYGVTSISIPGYWIHKNKDLEINAPPFPGEKVLMYLHGGAFKFDTAHPDGPMSVIPKGHLQHTPSLGRSFNVEYRLTTGPPLDPSNPFPTALLDVLAGYIYLVNMGFAEKDIIISGDSAGSQLALGLTKYLIDNKVHQPKLPSIPGALILLSAWSDMSECFVDNPDPQSSLVRNLNYDWLGPINKGSLRHSATSFVGDRPGHSEEAATNPYISPASPRVLGLAPGSKRSISFKGFPRAFIDVGSHEVFLDQVVRLRDAMIEDMGPEMVQYNEADWATHDYLSFKGHEPERTETFKKIADWLEQGF